MVHNRLAKTIGVPPIRIHIDIVHWVRMEKRTGDTADTRIGQAQTGSIFDSRLLAEPPADVRP